MALTGDTIGRMTLDRRLRLVLATILGLVGVAIVAASAAISQMAEDTGRPGPSPVVYVVGVLLLACGVGLYQTRRPA
jgi:hypothetical protein